MTIDAQENYIHNMIKEAVQVSQNAYARYSNFPVGACVKSDKDKYYTGCNVENGSYSLAVCAEVSAIANMIANGCTVITDIVVLSIKTNECQPCGACRQVIHEFSNDNTKIHLCSFDGSNIRTLLAKSLLPEPFVL